MSSVKLAWSSHLVFLALASVSASEPAATEFRIGGPFVPDLQAGDDFATVVQKLGAVQGVSRVTTKFKDFAEVPSREAVFAAIKEKADETPSLLKTMPGIDKPMLATSAFAVATTEFEGTPITIRVNFASSPGLIFKSPEKALLTKDAEFYVPLFIERVDVALRSGAKDASSLAVKSQPKISAAVEAAFASFVPTYGTVERTKSASGELFRLAIHYPVEEFKVFCVNGHSSEAEKEKKSAAAGFLIFEAKSDPSRKDWLDALYAEHVAAK